MKIFKQYDILKQLASRMGDYADVDDFHPLDNVEHDYRVLEWMRNVVRVESADTHSKFISYISGPMHRYVVGDYVKAAIIAIGVEDVSKH